MRVTQQRHFNLSAAKLMERLTQQEFYESRFAVQGVESYQFEQCAAQAEGFVVHIVRTIEVDMNRIPSFARRFVNSTMPLVTRFVWQNHAEAPFFGAYTVKIGNAPVSIEGKVQITEVAEHQCQQLIDIEINSAIPVMGKKIARALAERVEEVIEKDYQATLQVLAAEAKG